MRVKSLQLLKFCGNLTDPAAETKSIGLAADAHGVMVFASQSGQFYRAPGLPSQAVTSHHD